MLSISAVGAVEILLMWSRDRASRKG